MASIAKGAFSQEELLGAPAKIEKQAIQPETSEAPEEVIGAGELDGEILIETESEWLEAPKTSRANVSADPCMHTYQSCAHMRSLQHFDKDIVRANRLCKLLEDHLETCRVEVQGKEECLTNCISGCDGFIKPETWAQCAVMGCECCHKDSVKCASPPAAACRMAASKCHDVLVSAPDQEKGNVYNFCAKMDMRPCSNNVKGHEQCFDKCVDAVPTDMGFDTFETGIQLCRCCISGTCSHLDEDTKPSVETQVKDSMRRTRRVARHGGKH